MLLQHFAHNHLKSQHKTGQRTPSSSKNNVSVNDIHCRLKWTRLLE